MRGGKCYYTKVVLDWLAQSRCYLCYPGSILICLTKDADPLDPRDVLSVNPGEQDALKRSQDANNVQSGV